MEDGWYRLPSGCAVQVLDGLPVRICDGGQFAQMKGCFDDELEVRILAEASLALGLPLELLAPFEGGTGGGLAFADVVSAP
jgi:hypothetical protein